MTPDELIDLLNAREADVADLGAQAAAWRGVAHDLLDNLADAIAAQMLSENEGDDDGETLH